MGSTKRESVTRMRDWPDWYDEYMVREQAGEEPAVVTPHFE